MEELVKLNEPVKKILTPKQNHFKLPLTTGFNFAQILNIQVLANKSKPSELVLNWNRTAGNTGQVVKQRLELAKYEAQFAIKTIEGNEWHVLQTSQIQFFKDGNNFAVNGRSIELGIEPIEGTEDFEVEIYVKPIDKYQFL